MFEQVLALLEHLAEAGPVVLVIEDAHWSDRSTRDLLAFLIGNQQVLAGVLIVVTFRSDELHRRHPLRPVLAELDRLGWVARLELPRLTRREGRELMACVAGPGARSRGWRSGCSARSEGNPLFLEALLRCDESRGSDLPESLRDLVLADVSGCPRGPRTSWRRWPLAGEQCGHALLAAVTGIGDRELLAALRLAVAANVLIPGGDGYAFRHALIREAVLGQVLPGEKTRLHIRLAEALAADPSLVPPGRAVIEQAHHWYAAHDLPGRWPAPGRPRTPPGAPSRTPRSWPCWPGSSNSGTPCPTPRSASAPATSASWKPRRTPPWPRARTSAASGSRPPR